VTATSAPAPTADRPIDASAGDLAAEAAPPTAGSGPLPWGRILRHVVAYLILLLVVAAATDLASPWMSDDGAYASQVRLIEDGSWGYHDAPSWGTPPSDVPTLGKSSVIDGIEHPYVKHPVWVEVLRASDRIDLPIVGMVAVNVLAAVAAAAIAARLGSDRRAGILAFWAVALGPPLVWSTGLWAHAPAVALGGVAVLGLVRWRSRPSLTWVAVMGAAVAGLALVRSEGLLLALGLGVAQLAHLVEHRADRAVRVRTIVAGLVVAGAAIAAKVLELRIVAAVAPGTETAVPAAGGDWVAGRVSGFEATFLSGGFDPQPYAFGILSVLVLVAGGWVVSRRPNLSFGPVLVLLGVALVAVRAVTGFDALIPGLFAAAPLLTLGLATLRPGDLTPTERTLGVVAAVYAAAVIATQYPDGGATEWGGRFLAPILVPLAVLAAGALVRLTDRARTPRPLAVGVAAALVLLPVLPALGSTNSNRATHAAIAHDLEAAHVDAAIATYPTLPLLLWPTVDRIPWTVVGDQPQNSLPKLVERAHAAGEQRLAIVGIAVDPTVVEGLGYTVDLRSPHLLVLTAER
jgi:hypothetical protein